MSPTPFTRRALSTGILLLAQACTHATGKPEPANQSYHRAMDEVRQAIQAHRHDVERCLQIAASFGPFGAEKHSFEVVFGVEHHAQEVSKTPALAILGECLKTAVRRWTPSVLETTPPLVVSFQLRPSEDITDEQPASGFRPTVLARDQGHILSFDVGHMWPPKFISGPDVLYTVEALEHGIEGEAQVKCRIRVTGEVADCHVLKSLPYMDEAMLDAVTKRRYQPVRWNDEPVEVSYVFNFRFKLPQAKPPAPAPVTAPADTPAY